MSTLDALGGEDGCEQLSRAFYSRVAADPRLKRLFPGKSVRCATEELAAFLIQLLNGDEARTQKRWWLSLSESHSRFTISQEERSAWLEHMSTALEATVSDERVRKDLSQFFREASLYVAGKQPAEIESIELHQRWAKQLELDACIEAIAAGRKDEAVTLAEHFVARPSVYAGILMRMLRQRSFLAYVITAVERDPSRIRVKFNGRTLLHAASAAGQIDLLQTLLRLGADPNVLDSGGHGPLYHAANGSGGTDVVNALIAAGADVNARQGVTRATPLHMAARRGNLAVAQALLNSGADPAAGDAKGVTPPQRAINCRHPDVAKLILEWRP